MNFRILPLCVIGVLMGGVMRGQCPPGNPLPPNGSEGQVGRAKPTSSPGAKPSATPSR